MAKSLSGAEILEELDSLESELDDSCLDPDYIITGEDTADSTSVDSEPCLIRRKKTDHQGCQLAHETEIHQLEKSARKKK